MIPDGVPDPIAVALDFAHIFERLDVRYVTVGSLASSVHGEPRSTNDVDFVADLRLHHLETELKVWAERVGVADLMEAARREASD